MKKIQIGDFKIGREEKKAINDVLNSGRISEGAKVAEFERRWANYIGTKFSVTTSSGSGALITGLTSLKYKYKLAAGTKVITTPITYIASSSAVSVVGFEPIYVDIDPITFGITPEAIHENLETAKFIEKYKIILPVDLFGFSVRIDEIVKIAKKNNLSVFEDAAQAEGTTYKGKMAGSQADLACYSFYIAHNIQAGEMGALVTDDQDIYRLARKIKAQGRTCECPICTRSFGGCPKKDSKNDPRFYHEYLGYNFKTMEFQAILALLQLERIKKITEQRQTNVLFLNKRFAKYQDLFQLPPFSSTISYLAYPIVIKNPKVISREDFCHRLEKEGIETRPIFPCIPTQQPAYRHLAERYRGKLPQAEYVSKNGFYIGCHQYLGQGDLENIVKAFRKILE